MCRFVAYLGKKPVVLSDILEKPSNSLIQQSRHALKLKLPVNADGFGIAWYQKSIDSTPGIFKSIQPAWNDLNLHHIANRINSKCFIGHVRASTVGNVSRSNCHPFSHKKYSFCHNGGIENFELIQRALRSSLPDKIYEDIIGQTDSEHLFGLLMNEFLKVKKHKFTDFLECFKKAAEQIIFLQNLVNVEADSLLNTVVTDGEQLMATRYTSTDKEALSLFYTVGHHINSKKKGPVMEFDDKNPSAVLVASEPLGDYTDQWHAVPANHAILVNKKLEISLPKIL
ncbi:MAG: class II glutamine amidotransferase [Legionellaceae bacterium]|nr:class II glutamine amidotransferase [Legionellaceae bacterium]